VFEQATAVLTALRGPDLLRVKGLVAVAGCLGPVVVQACSISRTARSSSKTGPTTTTAPARLHHPRPVARGGRGVVRGGRRIGTVAA